MYKIVHSIEFLLELSKTKQKLRTLQLSINIDVVISIIEKIF